MPSTLPGAGEVQDFDGCLPQRLEQMWSLRHFLNVHPFVLKFMQMAVGGLAPVDTASVLLGTLDGGATGHEEDGCSIEWQ